METKWFYVPVNPEPWETGGLSIHRKGGKTYPMMVPSGQLVAYKEAVREELEGEAPLPWREFQLTFYFWRKLESSLTVEKGRKVTRHQVDATNMQKALEDALQGVLFGNDRDVRRIESVIVEQSTDCKTPRTFIRADEWTGFDVNELPMAVFDLVAHRVSQERPLGWLPPEDPF